MSLPSIGVLVVDDDPESRDMLAAVIEKAGYSVATASDGQEALDLLGEIAPELIFLDVRMPVLDGARFREEQRHHREWLRIPTVVMTGVEEEPQLDPAIRATLRKPVRPRELLALVQQHCTHKVAL